MLGTRSREDCQPPGPSLSPQEAQCHEQPEPCQYEHNHWGHKHCDSLSLQFSVDLDVGFGHDCGFA